jgi:pimeloyl-ACP methyl ester carboxylesterase
VGVVLIDSSSPQQIDELPGWRRSYEADKHDFARQLRWEKLLVWLGWERLMGRCRVLGGEDSEFMYFETTCKQAARLTSFGNVPLLIISQDPDRQGMTASAIAEQPVWAREQEALKSLSPSSWRVIARGSGHNVHHERLDVVVAEMNRLLFTRQTGPGFYGYHD